MSEPTMTLDKVARLFECGPSIHYNNAKDAQAAALVRAAGEVVEAAQLYVNNPASGCSTTCASWNADADCNCGYMAAVGAVAAFDAISKGETK